MYAPPVQMIGMPLGPYYSPEKFQQMQGRWSDGLCSCCSDCSTMCCAWLCEAILMHQVIERLPYHVRPMVRTDSCLYYLATRSCRNLPCIRSCIIGDIRRAVAAAYNIPVNGGCVEDCLFGCCSLARSARQVNRGQGFMKK